MAQAQGTDSISKRKSTGSADTLPEVMQSPLVGQLKGDIARLESRLKEVSGNLGVNHPQYLRSQAELAEMKSKMNAEIARIASSINTAGNISKQKQNELIAAVNAQKTRILELRKQRDEITLLAREVETAQRAFEAVGQRTTQSRLESQSVQTNVAVLNPASEPIKPSKPRVLLNILVSIFLGILLGVGAALTLELLNRRIRSPEDLSLALGLPVLAVLESEARPSTWKSRLASLLPNRQAKTA